METQKVKKIEKFEETKKEKGYAKKVVEHACVTKGNIASSASQCCSEKFQIDNKCA